MFSASTHKDKDLELNQALADLIQTSNHLSYILNHIVSQKASNNDPADMMERDDLVKAAESDLKKINDTKKKGKAKVK
jgi:hypothetical protein